MSAIWLNEIGAHYARTLELWRERFVANSDLAVQILFAKPERSNRLTGEWRREPARVS